LPKKEQNVSALDPTLLERFQARYQRLSSIASELNAATDNLGAAIAGLDEALKKLNLGIPSWYKYDSFDRPDGYYTSTSIGYARVGSKWGIALKRESGHEQSDDSHSEDTWLFNDAPRHLRLEAADELPKMIDQLIRDAENAVETVNLKGSEVRFLADALTPASPSPARPRSKSGANGEESSRIK
jgi:hypothetical protein